MVMFVTNKRRRTGSGSASSPFPRLVSLHSFSSSVCRLLFSRCRSRMGRRRYSKTGLLPSPLGTNVNEKIFEWMYHRPRCTSVVVFATEPIIPIMTEETISSVVSVVAATACTILRMTGGNTSTGNAIGFSILARFRESCELRPIPCARSTGVSSFIGFSAFPT